MADDMGYGDLSCLNPESRIPTPQMDRLAAEGVVFTDAHSGSSVCTPTRYGLLTGRYSWRTRLKKGVLNGYSRSLVETHRLTVASLLKKNGYHTAWIGKWHLGPTEYSPENPQLSLDEFTHPLRPGSNELGFDYWFGIPASLDMAPYVYIKNGPVTDSPTGRIEASPRPAL
ncbi:MAG: sulfatase-like hydrolase/transferase [Candidatus Aminicenantes bacterium]|nr:sulfatase-like hydrolase/transferase [Candidatus Aminicenantes bacterium]